MRRLLRRGMAWYREPAHKRAIKVGMVSMGTGALVWLLKDNETRFNALEERGLAPLDDFVTVGDLDKVDDRLRVLEGKPPRSSVIDVDALAARPTVLPAGPHGAGEEGNGVGELE